MLFFSKKNPDFDQQWSLLNSPLSCRENDSVNAGQFSRATVTINTTIFNSLVIMTIKNCHSFSQLVFSACLFFYFLSLALLPLFTFQCEDKIFKFGPDLIA
ncbi:hypothetical protein CHARACLAT_011801 [Characodon lateralis]|uniref:Uncharacterized protein n=1 Tax=Characodon lateralis TaxID=208331 RepID=A0ABU7D6N5_9TELE|nr:hypothetical protein [Characodon lateralis]